MSATAPATHLLTWGQPGHAPSYALTAEQAEELVTGWRPRGVVTGTLADGDLMFRDSFGKTARITHLRTPAPVSA